LIIGGVAVQLSALPVWAQHVSAFFPGRYAVEALQACVTGRGIAGARFALAALVVIGAGGIMAGGKLFRWDAQERFAAQRGKAWLSWVVIAWLAIGWLAEERGRAPVPAPVETAAPPAAAAPIAAAPLPPKPVA